MRQLLFPHTGFNMIYYYYSNKIIECSLRWFMKKIVVVEDDKVLGKRLQHCLEKTDMKYVRL